MSDMLTLTHDDVQSLRRATGVVFFADSEGRAKVRALNEKYHDPVFSEVEQRIFPGARAWKDGREREREFRVNGVARSTSGLSSWGPTPLDGKRLIGSYFLMSAAFDSKWRTIAMTAKEGSALELVFLADHSTHQSLHDVGYHADDFILRIWRNGERREREEFLVDVGVGPHNSARMIRAEGDPSQLTSSLDIDAFWEDAA